ncbi:MAG: hypothetical protein F6K22_27340 [Okeania sp. SIO2F4]|uniref:hypothetical protein n=1 Tax=Okeania sp. SIO2F4 TaxID=2607790 RepID=UPI001428EEA8|nr:hypothetical protein [Okeania sp. SIO2F4]NES06195.1 hypothetical protein [Okeania sp. SIO2F4]
MRSMLVFSIPSSRLSLTEFLVVSGGVADDFLPVRFVFCVGGGGGWGIDEFGDRFISCSCC